ncbi:MAG: PrgI family protein, partial [Actinobacteria bacterium]
MTGVRIPADVDREDRLLAGLTARQLAYLAVGGLALAGAWSATRAVVPLPVFAVAASPLAALLAVVALGRRDGMAADRLALAFV